ncbi:MAG: hypothetical protein ACTSXT_13580 [Candidatus Helarchaeota archaeon]
MTKKAKKAKKLTEQQQIAVDIQTIWKKDCNEKINATLKSSIKKEKNLILTCEAQKGLVFGENREMQARKAYELYRLIKHDGKIYDPISIDTNGHVVNGFHRAAIAQLLKLELPIQVLEISLDKMSEGDRLVELFRGNSGSVPTSKDHMKMITVMYREEKTMQEISEVTGLLDSTIKKYLKVDQENPLIKKMLEKGRSRNMIFKINDLKQFSSEKKLEKIALNAENKDFDKEINKFLDSKIKAKIDFNGDPEYDESYSNVIIDYKNLVKNNEEKLTLEESSAIINNLVGHVERLFQVDEISLEKRRVLYNESERKRLEKVKVK